jgi:hypothetical protein
LTVANNKVAFLDGVQAVEGIPVMRCIYIYDPDRQHIIEGYDVTAESEFNCEILKLHLLVKCRFPWGVFDSLEDDLEETSEQLWPENIKLSFLSDGVN